MPQDGNPDALAETAVSAVWVAQALGRLRATTAVVWYDTSFSGRGARWGTPSAPPLAGIKPKRGAVWIAAPPNRVAEETLRTRRGRFTESLLTALRGEATAAPAVWKRLVAEAKARAASPVRLGTLPPTLHLATSRAATHELPTLVMQDGHSDTVLAVAFDKSGARVATAGRDNTIKLWDVDSGRVLATLSGHESAVLALAWAPDGRSIATAGHDGTVRLWHVGLGTETARLDGHRERVRAIAYRPDGGLIASGSADERVILWDPAKRRKVGAFKVGTTVMDLAFSPDGRSLAVARADGGVGIWNVSAKRRLALQPKAHGRAAAAVVFTRDGKTLLSGGTDDRIRAWAVADLAASGATDRDLDGTIRSLALSDDGATVMAAAGKEATRWRVPSLGSVGEPVTHKGVVTDVAWRAGGAGFATTAGRYAAIWATTGEAVELSGILEGRTVALTGLAVGPGGRSLWTGARDGSVRRWDLDGGQLAETLQGAARWGQQVAVDRAGRSLVAAGFRHTAKIWDPATGALRHTLEGPSVVTAVAVAPDGAWVGTGGRDGVVRLWDAASGEAGPALEGLTDDVTQLVFGPNSRRVAAISKAGGLIAWDLSPDAPRQLFERLAKARPEEATAVALTPTKGRLLVGRRDGRLTLYALPDGRKIRGMRAGHASVSAIAFAEGSERFATGSADGTIYRWDGAGHKPSAAMKGHTSPVTGVAFLRKDAYLASTSKDSSLMFWDVDAGAQLATAVQVGDDGDWGVSLPDGRFDATAGARAQMEWRIGERLFALDQFYNDFFTPGLLARLMAGRRLPPPRPLARIKPPPIVKIASPKVGTKATSPTIAVDIDVADQGGGIAKVWLYHNGHRLPERRGVVRVEAEPIRYEVALVEGDNHLRATAYNADGAIESRGDEIVVSYDVPMADKPVLHIVSIGLDSYEAGLNLSFAVADASAVGSFFEPGLFGAVNRHVLTNDTATAAAIRRALARVAQEAKPRDAFILYLAGHGALVGQMFYFLPHDVRVDSEASIRGTALSGVELAERMSAIPATKQVLLLDACHSGAAASPLGKLLARRDALGLIQAQQRLARSSGSFLIAASTAEQYAKEVPELGHGVLTHALLNGLGKFGDAHAADRGGQVTVNGLIRWVAQEVPRLTARYHGGRQDVVQESSGQDFPLLKRR